LAGPERLSRFEFGKVLCSVRGHNERLIEGVFQQQVEDKSGIPRPPGKQKTGKKRNETTQNFPFHTQKTTDLSMNSTKIVQELQIHLTPAAEGLRKSFARNS
jgi:hypothetical protein